MRSRHSLARHAADWCMRRRRTACERLVVRRPSGIEIRARPVSDRRGVGDETDALAPVVQLVARWLEREAEPRLRAEIEDDLMRRAGRRPSDCAAEAAVDRPREWTAENSLDPGMTTNDLGKGSTAAEAGSVHPFYASHKGRMVHQDQGRPIRRSREGVIVPLQPLRTQEAAAFARDQSVEPDDAQRIAFDHVVDDA